MCREQVLTLNGVPIERPTRVEKRLGINTEEYYYPEPELKKKYYYKYDEYEEE